MNVRPLFLILCLFAFIGKNQAQKDPSLVSGNLIVRLSEGITPQAWLKLRWPGRQFPVPITWQRALGKRFNIHLFAIPEALTGDENWLDDLRRDPAVVAAQWDFRLEFRDTHPDDPYYPEQWDLDRIALPKVWDITTGGLTALGDTIVVAYLDSGFNVDHPELRDNIWHNQGEIPGDGIDNDNNGYIDDWMGWNYIDAGPVHRVHFHGHQGASIVGATGNNGYGIAGINWHVKLMLFDTELISQAIEAYQYVIDQRSAYNQTEGAEGAFVVATNASFGFGRRFCSDAPIWGQMYDPLGAAGVLTAAAADNKSYDVDELGDLPATCPSKFLIGVMNTTVEDKPSQQTAFGKENIDLAAPGDGSGSVSVDGEFDLFDGNSAAAPHVTGAIALLYSLPCEALAQDALKTPEGTALKIRQAILSGVDVLPSLKGKNATEGRLNVLGAVEKLQAGCGSTTGPLEIMLLNPNPVRDQLGITFESPDFEDFQMEVFDALGRKVHIRPVNPPRFGEKKVFLDTTPLPAGTYFLRLKKGKDTFSAKFIKI
ncbi:MAG: S8 family peptidase [Lewinellaceae bacterium]|nr:S8 family peptidase [Lewinellaceae bacterium]